MKSYFGEVFSNLLIFEPRQYVVSLWKNNFVQMLPNAHIKVVTNQKDFMAFLANPKFNWSLVIVNWDHQEGSHRWMKEAPSKDDGGCGFRRVSTVRSYEKYKETPLIIYTEKHKIGTQSQLYIKDLFHTHLIYTNSAPYGIIEKLRIILDSEKSEKKSSQEFFLLKKAKQYLADKEYKSALDELDKIKQDSDTILKYCALKLECFIECNRMDEASILISELFNHRALSPSILSLASEVFLRNGDSESAMKFLEIKQKTFPDSGENRIAMARIQRKSGNIEAAKKILRLELKVNRLLQKQIFSNLVSILMDEADYEGALKLADQEGFSITDDVAKEIANKAVTLSKEGKCIICINLIEKFMPYINGYIAEGTALYYIGKTYLEIGNYFQAINMLSKSIAIHPDLTPAVRCLVKALGIYRGMKDPSQHKPYDEDLLKQAIRKRAKFLTKALDRKIPETEAEVLNLFDKSSKVAIATSKMGSGIRNAS